MTNKRRPKTAKARYSVTNICLNMQKLMASKNKRLTCTEQGFPGTEIRSHYVYIIFCYIQLRTKELVSIIIKPPVEL